MESIGVVVNPIAGMGGRVGLKGTDGNVAEARRRGAEPRAPARAREALRSVHRRAPSLTVYTAAGVMGERAARDAGYEPTVVYDPSEGDRDTASDGAEIASDPATAETTAADTRAAVRALLEHDVDLVFFVGGDGTAVDVAEVLDAEGDETGETPMLGVPAGVKIYSSVFGVTPADAGRIAAEFDRVEPREVNDIDEDAYREGEVRTELKAVVPVPVAPAVQSGKQVSSGSVDSLAAGFAREVEPGRTYVFGPGSTVGAIETELGIDLPRWASTSGEQRTRRETTARRPLRRPTGSYSPVTPRNRTFSTLSRTRSRSSSRRSGDRGSCSVVAITRFPRW